MKIKLWYDTTLDIFVIVEGKNVYKYTENNIAAFMASLALGGNHTKYSGKWYKATIKPSKEYGFEYLGEL